MHLFDGVHYYLSPSLSGQRVLELTHVLDNNGAIRTDSLDDPTLTHCITNSHRFEGWQVVEERVKEAKISVTTDKWVDKSMLLGKLQPTTCYSADPAMIFSGVVGCAAELPAPDLEVLSAGITALGGQWRTGLTRDVTHLFVISPNSPKYETALHFQDSTQVKVILPHWFDDAVRLAHGQLDTSIYEWPDPPYLRGPEPTEEGEKGREETIKKIVALRKIDPVKTIMFKTAELLDVDAPLPIGMGDESTPQSSGNKALSPGKVKNVWQGRRVLLGRSLEMVGSRREAVEAEIRRSGGKTVSFEGGREEEAAKVDECDVFVTRYRCGKAYVKAVRQTKTIGTLPWVFHIQSTGIFSPPMDQLLWYPIPKRPIDGFCGHEITVTNYTGEAREYIKKLIVAMGATFTPSMSGKNTVLIAAYISGTKTTKAASWSIPIVNHIWLEDCFVRWRNLTVALERYIIFPPEMDFSRMLGERGVGRRVEDVPEEELEILEREEEEEEELVGKEKEKQFNVVEDSGKKISKNGGMVPTQNSAKDAREVEEFVSAGLDDVDEDGDARMAVEARGPEALFDTGSPDGPNIAVDEPNRNDSDDDRMQEDRQEEEEEAPMKPTPTPRSTGRSLQERLRDKGESAAKTRVRKGKPKPKSIDSDDEGGKSPTPEVRVRNKKNTTQAEVAPAKKRGRPSKVSKRKAASSSSSDEVEVVDTPKSVRQEKGKGTSRLVKNARDTTNSWIMDTVEITPVKTGTNKKATRAENTDNEEEEEEAVPQLKKKSLKKLPSKKVFSDDDRGDHDETDVVVLSKGKKPPTKRKALYHEEGESEDEVVTASKGKKRKSNGKQMQEEEELLVKGKGRSRASITHKATAQSTSKTRPKSNRWAVSDEESSSEPESEEEVVVASTSRVKTRAKAVEKTPERPKPRPMGKIKKVVVDLVESSDEEPTPPKRTPAKAQTSSSKSKKKLPSPPPSDDEDDVTPPPLSTAKSSAKNAQTHSSGKKGRQAKSPTPTEDGEEEDASEPSPPPAKTNRAKGRLQPSTVAQKLSAPIVTTVTPKRTVSVLLPQLILSTKKSPPTYAKNSPLARSESIRVAAGERASSSRAMTSTVLSGPSAKIKAKAKHPAPAVMPSSPLSPPPGDEDDSTSIATVGRSKRSAAAKATQKLHEEIMPDVMNYQQEMRTAGRRSFGGVVLPAGPGGASNSTAKKRQSIGRSEEDVDERDRDPKRRKISGVVAAKKKAYEESEEEEDEEEHKKPVKGKGKRKAIDDDDDDDVVEIKHPVAKTKKGNKAEDHNSNMAPKTVGTVTLMTTQVSLSDDVVKALTKLGVRVTSRPPECTHLLAPHLVRTEKFLCAVANGAFILTEKWATDSAAARRLLDEEKYLLHDKTNERKFEFVLADALTRAKQFKGTLFAKMTFYITPKVPIDVKLLKNVVTACGGQVHATSPTLRILGNAPNRYIISCQEDQPTWRPIAEVHPVYTHELILTSALKQEIDWTNEKYKVEGSY